MAQIDYYFTTISPWAYLAGTRAEEIAARHGATITYKPMDIVRVFSQTGGKPLNERPQARQDYRLQELRRTGVKTGLPLNIHPAHFPTNPAPASYAIIAAQKDGGGDVGLLTHALMRACWAEERDIAQDDVIKACLTEAGFDAGIADSGLLTGAVAYESNTEDALRIGAFGSPFYVVDGAEKFWGQDRLDDLDLFLAGKL